jgi:hypothetical protein
MHLVQLLLPTHDNQKRRFPRQLFDEVRRELAEKFGGVTAFVRSPAIGLWRDNDDEDVSRDDVVMFEVMCNDLDESWWSHYRTSLEDAFRQDELMVRAILVRKL